MRINKKLAIKQHDLSDCGATCLASVSEFYNLRIPIAKIRQYASTNKKGTTLLGLRDAAIKLNFNAKGVKASIDNLEDIPLPAIAHVIIKSDVHQLPHFVVLYKVSSKKVLIMDPSTGRMERLSITQFDEIFTGILLILVPDEEVFVSKNEVFSNWKRLMFLLRPHVGIFVQSVFAAILYTVLGFSISIYIEKITDFVLASQNINLLNMMSIVVLLCLIFQMFFGILKDVFILRIGQQIDSRLILGYYKYLFTMPQKFFDTMRIGELMSRISDAIKIRTLINETFLSITVNVFIVLFSFVFMYTYYWKLAVIITLIIPLYIIIYIISNYLNRLVERLVMEKNALLEAQLVESIKNIGTIKRASLEDYIKTKTEFKFIDLLGSVYKSGLNGIFSNTSTSFISKVFTVILLWVGSIYVIDGDITPGELFSFYSVIGYFTTPAMQLIETNKSIQNALIAADRLFGIMDLEGDNENGEIVLHENNIGDIQFREVGFQYEVGRNVFQDVSFSIPIGKLTAIVGESGSGKSTVASLIQSIYEPVTGKITIGDYDLRYIAKKSVNDHIATVPQNIELFDGTIASNIAIGEDFPDLERIIEVTRRVGALNFIESLPNGFDTYLGEFGAKLSGGERQRIAFARALYKNPKILILDEATSALDSKSERIIKDLINELVEKSKTVIIIAHKLKSITMADKILVFEKGFLVEEGKHEPLLERKGHYATLWNNSMI